MLRSLVTFLIIIDQIIGNNAFVGLACTQQSIRSANSLQMQQQAPNRRDIISKSLLLAPAIFATSLKKPVLALTPDELNQIKLYKNSVPSVCFITTDYNVSETDRQASQKFGLGKPQGIGSGFVYDNKGHIVTNFHVINRCINATVKFIDKDGVTTEYVPRLTGYDQDKDIAVLKIEAKQPLKPSPLSTNKNIKIGMNCYALGNPFGKPFSFTMGIVSGKDRDISAPSGRKIDNVIQSDVPINKGNSGGPLIDSSGRLIGINTAIFGGDVSTGISLSVAVDDVKKTVENILKNGVIDHPTLGIEYLTAVPTLSEALKSGLTYVDSGVVILKVIQGSAAQRAGLTGLQRKSNKTQLGDVIVEIDETPVKNPEEMAKILDGKKPSDYARFKVLRGNDLIEMYIDVVLGSSNDNLIGLAME
jgi:S1-C subfamily serine protease